LENGWEQKVSLLRSFHKVLGDPCRRLYCERSGLVAIFGPVLISVGFSYERCGSFTLQLRLFICIESSAISFSPWLQYGDNAWRPERKSIVHFLCSCDPSSGIIMHGFQAADESESFYSNMNVAGFRFLDPKMRIQRGLVL
jgi:hypothetical protein